MLMYLHHVTSMWHDPQAAARRMVGDLEPFGHTPDSRYVGLNDSDRV
jgi:hypothetical protein